jgi:shikimate dehydrogenase
MIPLQFILIGHPVGHSVSPQIHTAAYRAHALPHSYAAVDCPDEAAVERQVARVRSGEIAGANVTVPWKRVALALADELDDSARDTNAANVLVRTASGQVRAYNTDQGALAERLKHGAATSKPACVVVIGNGGAGLAAAVAARRIGAERVVVTARRWQGAPEAWPDRSQFEALGAHPVAWETGPGPLHAAFAAADVIVQATSAGMKGVGGGDTVVEVIPWQALASNVFLYDVVYNPPVTPFIERASHAGLRVEGGLSMLVGQAGLAIQIWLGVEPPLQAMREAAEAVLFGGHA